MITTTDALADAVSRAREAGAVGVDTEFIWERTFYPTLGLVQIGYPDGSAELIDAPAIEDWSPLAELMSDPDTVKILHDAQQDLTILHPARWLPRSRHGCDWHCARLSPSSAGYPRACSAAV